MFRKQVAFFLFLVHFAFAQNSKPNFTGTWKCQNYEVDFIEHEEPILNISPAVRRADVIFTYIFRTDGQVLGTTRRDRDEVNRSGRWDGNYLVLETKRIHDGAQTTERTTLSLSANGRQLTRHTQLFGPDDKKQVDDVLVFDKIADGVRGIRLGDSKDVVAHE